MKRLLGAFTLALVVPAALVAADAKSEDKRSEDKAKPLIGQYDITGGEKDGTAIPAERLKGSTVAITGDTIAVVDGQNKELYSAKYKLAEVPDQKGIWRVDMASKVPREGAKAAGLIKLDGEQVWLIYSIGEARPDGFDKTEQGQHLFKLKRTAKPADQKGSAAGNGGAGSSGGR